MRFKRDFKRKWKYPHPKDSLKLDKDYNEAIEKIDQLNKETDKLLKQIELKRTSKESIRLFLENM